MEGFIDMHCHILPGVDDGAKDIKETKEMLRIAYEEGIRCIIATPHHHPKRGKESPKILRRQAKLVREAAQVVPQVGYVGWDVCFTPEGPCLVEGNQFPGHDIYQLPVHTPDKIGIMPRFRAIEAEEALLGK